MYEKINAVTSKVDCDIISDLLPLYCDHVCSEKSRHLVEDHLEHCQECRLLLKVMDTECRVSDKQEQSGEAVVKDMASIWKKSVWQSFKKGLFTALCICLFIFGSYWGLTRWAVVNISSKNVEVKVENCADKFEIHMEVMDGNKVYSLQKSVTEDGKLYIAAKRGAVAVRNGLGNNWEGTLTIPKVTLSEKGNRVEVQEIYYGSESNSMLVWPED